MSTTKNTVTTQPLPFRQEQVATNQQNAPLPYPRGENLVAGRWISPAIEKVTQQAATAGKKG